MADDCVCTNLASIYMVLNDIATSLKYGSNSITYLQNNNMRLISRSIDALATSIGTLNDIVNELDDLFRNNGNTVASILESATINRLTGSAWLSVIHNDLNAVHNDLGDISLRFTYDNKNIAEIWSLKDMCVSNETIVESPMSTYVSKGVLEFNDI